LIGLIDAIGLESSTRWVRRSNRFGVSTPPADHSRRGQPLQL